jgi:hypothetical protein
MVAATGKRAISTERREPNDCGPWPHNEVLNCELTERLTKPAGTANPFAFPELSDRKLIFSSRRLPPNATRKPRAKALRFCESGARRART